ncbi:M20/M25/M40 family metallo-hydrolase [candidate division WOR-3 bacterium]|uniref:M20/M25/M40 family metallo-hydrolase n=1 Tax=candidate division WOR-3 bacterium TaxID=2052148 RepID=A0A9D5QCD7_UNCW3|nr:M20/M25/M40 family metallo-hydrolase [candidate division WOR-3 bacterium]MBD3363912.1 M20/M25/M40 family metallo-hydrolase [candidate division WOR-3 bacterium]
MFKDLTEGFGPSGYEDDIRKLMIGYLKPNTEVSTDKLGSVVGYHQGSNPEGPKVLITGHMDEVGFMVKQVTKQGYIKFLPVGGWWPQVLLSQRVKVRTRKGDFEGIIGSKPPHMMKEEERKKPPEMDKLFIDVGVAGEKGAKNIDARPGDPIVPIGDFRSLENGVLAAKAWDNRIGCAIVAEVAADLKKGLADHPNRLYLAASVQEEVGLRGAKTLAGLIQPDIAIALDVSLAHDTPGGDADAVEKFGSGAAILVSDSTMIPNIKLRDFVIDVAEAEKISYHLTSLRGGYDTGAIHTTNAGVPSLALGLPSRYIHSHVSAIYEDDYVALLKLVKAVVKRMDAAKLAEITDFS